MIYKYKYIYIYIFIYIYIRSKKYYKTGHIKINNF